MVAGAYRVFSCDGSTAANNVIIAAAEMAFEDGMDIINLCAAIAHVVSRQHNTDLTSLV